MSHAAGSWQNVYRRRVTLHSCLMSVTFLQRASVALSVKSYCANATIMQTSMKSTIVPVRIVLSCHLFVSEEPKREFYPK
jgi:hypothetical protein